MSSTSSFRSLAIELQAQSSVVRRARFASSFVSFPFLTSLFLRRFHSRVHPVVLSAGHIILGGKAISAVGEAMFVHAVQGMRPNLVSSSLFLFFLARYFEHELTFLEGVLLVVGGDQVARRWNFAFFSAPAGPDGKGRIRAFQSEVGTTVSFKRELASRLCKS